MSLQVNVVALLVIILTYTNATIRLTNLVCHSYDEPFASFPICKLNVIKRNTVALNLVAKLHKVPVTNISVNLEFLKKANGYHPFLYNQTCDFCQVMKNAKHISFIRVIANMISTNTNINHTCPYDHDIIIKNWVPNQAMFTVIPLPTGDYLFNIRIAAYNDWKALIQAYFSFSEQ